MEHSSWLGMNHENDCIDATQRAKRKQNRLEIERAASSKKVRWHGSHPAARGGLVEHVMGGKE